MCEKISNKERLRLLLQPWIKTEELALILGCSKQTASARMSEIHKRIMQKGKRTLRGAASSKEVIEYLEIDIQEIIDNVKIEQELGLYKDEIK